MMKVTGVAILVVALSVPLFCMSALASGVEEEVLRITKEELRSMLGSPGVVVVDVRGEKSWNTSTAKVRGAIRANRSDIASWSEKYSQDQTLVFY